MADDQIPENLTELIAGGRLGVLATIKRDGRPQLSTVMYAFDRDARVIRMSITDGRAKTTNLRRDARASFHVSSADGWAYAVAEGRAELTPVAERPDVQTVEELILLYRAVQGEHPDWDDFRRAMVADRRLVLRLHVERVYGVPPRG
ncbi:PPOX class F420-dependent oxidoreductase [Micromonospora sp. WMMA1363]|uniref:PPOX class F420-dependent oxidoreductase n=1 Tax=Micromonospora sp. WMMA1363 TaxID=3053985 RepID=UPI00259C89D8|nr:PPOX class F420-dependent oxidoreductase [Micromonospora sp. WMMA1363]MDM4720445.1 PPOX class F420-dependent oxidoreductase [Micromonospora sp. WMMA1363]